jgi:hypothetical protein
MGGWYEHTLERFDRKLVFHFHFVVKLVPRKGLEMKQDKTLLVLCVRISGTCQ